MTAESDIQQQYEELKPGLLNEDEDSRYDTARTIARLGKPILSEVISLTQSPVPLLREMACFMLGCIGEPPEPWKNLYPDGIPILVDLLANDPKSDVRDAAACALGFHKDPSTVPALIKAASDVSEDVRYGVTRALGNFYGVLFDENPAFEHLRVPVITTLLDLTRDPDDDVRDWAAFGLHNGDHDSPEVRARFWELLDDPYDDVRGEAAAGLGRFGERALIPRLRELLKEENTHSCYFEAAEYLGDASLLPEVLAAAEAWKEDLEEGEKLHYQVASAIESLEKVAAGIEVDRWWDPNWRSNEEPRSGG